MRYTLLYSILLINMTTSSIFASDLATAKKHYNNNDFYNARKIVSKLLKDQPDNADYLGLSARIEFEMGQFDKSIKQIQEAYERDKTWVELNLRYQVRVHFYRGNDKLIRPLVKNLSESFWETRRFRVLVDPPQMDMTRSKRYMIYTTHGFRSKKGAKFAAKVMDVVFDSYSKVFPFKIDKKLVSRVYIFDNSFEYNEFSKLLTGKGDNNSGLFYPSTKILVINADPKGRPVNEFGFPKASIKTMFHEGFHQFINKFTPNTPNWFNEGLADYFGYSEYLGRGKLKVGLVVKSTPRFLTRYQTIQSAILRNDPVAPLSLRNFMSPRNVTFGGSSSRSYVNYAQAWSFVHFLLHSRAMKKKGKKLVKAYFDALYEGRTAIDAHKLTFGKLNLEKLDKAWRAYVLQL